MAQVLLFVGRASKDIPTGIYTSERGVDGRGVTGVLGDAPHARAGFEIVIVALLSLSFVSLLLRRRLRRGHKLRDETTRTRSLTQRCTANRAEHWFIVSRSSCRTSARKAGFSARGASTTACAHPLSRRTRRASCRRTIVGRSSLRRATRPRSALAAILSRERVPKKGVVADSDALHRITSLPARGRVACARRANRSRAAPRRTTTTPPHTFM